MKQGTLIYEEYDCPCHGRINRRKISIIKSGFIFNTKTVYTYYYWCMDCGIRSGTYEIDITGM